MQGRRPTTAFSAWVSGYTVKALLDELGRAGHPATRNAVYEWLAGRTFPRVQHLAVMETLSAGRITARVMVHHRIEVKNGHGQGGPGALARGA